MEARGNVVVIRVDGAKLRTAVLRYNQARNQVSSDQPFVFDEPTRHIEGEGFTSDPDFNGRDRDPPRAPAASSRSEPMMQPCSLSLLLAATRGRHRPRSTVRRGD